MKKFALTTTAVLLGFTQWTMAAEDPTKTTAPAPAACCDAKDDCCSACKSPCSKTDKGVKCGEKAWLDIETVTLEAENGDPIAQYTVAYLVEADDIPAEDKAAKSREWYAKSLPGLEKAAADGSATACCALAHMYTEGKGVEKNPEMAAKYKKMYKELCHKKYKEWKEKKCADKKDCCPMGPGPVQPQPAQE